MAATSFKRSSVGDFNKFNSLLVGNLALLPIDPSSLSPNFWFDASDSSTITQTSGSVSEWANKGTGPNFIQPTSSFQPITGQTTINGLNVIDFETNKMQADGPKSAYSFLHNGTVFFIAFVLKKGVQTNTLINTIMDSTDFGNNATTTGFQFATRDDDLIRLRLNPDVCVIGDDLFFPEGDVIISALFKPAETLLDERIKYFRNFAQGAVINTLNGTASSSDSTQTLTIGFRPSDTSSLEFVGSYAEMIIVSGSNATEANRQGIVRYLNNKWGLV